MLNTLFFVLGISFTFFLLGLGFTALGRFFSGNRIWFARFGGILMILFGLYQLGIFGRSDKIEQEHRLPLRLDRFAMGPVPAFLLGFTFSFAWTPCVGPALGSVLLMAGSSATMGKGFFLIGVYTLGFVLPFIAVGLFTGAVLGFFKKYRSVVRYTVKVSAVLLILMGFMTLTGFMNNMTGYLSSLGNGAVSSQETSSADDADPSGQQRVRQHRRNICSRRRSRAPEALHRLLKHPNQTAAKLPVCPRNCSRTRFHSHRPVWERTHAL